MALPFACVVLTMSCRVSVLGSAKLATSTLSTTCGSLETLRRGARDVSRAGVSLDG